jgi:hypothetical protein
MGISWLLLMMSKKVKNSNQVTIIDYVNNITLVYVPFFCKVSRAKHDNILSRVLRGVS